MSGPTRAINVGDLTESKVHRWIKEGKAARTDGVIIIDLKKLGYGKLLGAGSTFLRLRIIVPMWSAQAVEKIKAAGGEVISSAVAEA